jgi:hypothetical protein
MSSSTFSYQASFDLFLKDLDEILEFVEPVDANKNTFSHRIYGLLLRVCTDFESLAKDLAIKSGDTTSPDKMNVKNYCKIETALHLEHVQVEFLSWRPRPIIFSPFHNWSTSSPPLLWYQDYNIVKHNRDSRFPLANLSTLVEAGSGLFALIAKASDFKWKGPEYNSWETENGQYTFWRAPFCMHGTN